MRYKNGLVHILMLMILVCASACNSIQDAEKPGAAGDQTAQDAIVSVKSYGFVDLEGAKVSAIIVEYNDEIDSSGIDPDTYTITDYTILQEQENGYDNVIEMDYDGIPGNEGQITRVYVNDVPAPADGDGKETGKYVIIEVNTDYMLSGQNLVYTSTMIAGVKQMKPVLMADKSTVEAVDKEIVNYTESETGTANSSNNMKGNNKQRSDQKKQESSSHSGSGENGRQGGNSGQKGMGGSGSRNLKSADKDKIILPEFAEGSGWTLNYIGDGAFKATHCYSEYTGQYEDFELPYSIYIPDRDVLDANKGKVSLVLHMEHAGGNDTDPMAALTSSKAASKMSSTEFQADHPAIIVVPQVEESRRSTDDLVASSEVNTAVWEMMDWLLKEYADYIDTDRIYGTGQSMGGMTILDMAAQRDNFFAGIAVVGAQWSNNYDKDYQHDGVPARSPENDPVSFSGDRVDAENYENWYYMISDDNILIQTCRDDEMATGEWAYTKEYLEMAGGNVAYSEWDPSENVDDQNKKGTDMLNRDSSGSGNGITWACFTKGSHMSTWKYGYRVDYPFEWLFDQNRQTEDARGKLEQLKSKWLGRDNDGTIIKGSGTNGLNSAQFTTGGPSNVYVENWTPESVEAADQ